MSKRWRIAGLVAAALVFALTVIRGTPVIVPLVDLPLVLQAAYRALATFAFVWMLEGIYLAVLWIRRRAGGGRPAPGG